MEIVVDPCGGYWTRCRCGYILAPAAENWRLYAGREVSDPGEIAASFRLADSMEIRRYCCPSCGQLKAVDVAHKDSPDFFDIRLSLI
jgi:N-methylhydantoinase B